MNWKSTPQARRNYATRWNGEQWVRCEYSELRPGDLFKAYAADGTHIDPCTAQPVPEDHAALCTALPVHSCSEIMESWQLELTDTPDAGWAVECYSGPLSQLMRQVAQ